MRIRVMSVAMCPEDRVAVARVQAVSARKLRGRPVAIIEVEVRLQVPADESPHVTRRRAREAAVDFLDVL